MNASKPQDSYKHKGLRKQLRKTIEQKGISDSRILDAIEKIPRHFFLESAFDELAYKDQALQIGEGQTISQPFTVAYQTQLLDIKSGDKILEIGTGSGYQACVLLELGARVYTIERIDKLFEKTSNLLPEMGYNPTMILGDGTLGAPKYAPYDKILLTAGAPKIPQALKDQLKTGGCIVAPVGERSTQQMVKLIKIDDSKFITQSYDQFRFVPLLGKQGWQK